MSSEHNTRSKAASNISPSPQPGQLSAFPQHTVPVFSLSSFQSPSAPSFALSNFQPHQPLMSNHSQQPQLSSLHALSPPPQSVVSFWSPQQSSSVASQQLQHSSSSSGNKYKWQTQNPHSFHLSDPHLADVLNSYGKPTQSVVKEYDDLACKKGVRFIYETSCSRTGPRRVGCSLPRRSATQAWGDCA